MIVVVAATVVFVAVAAGGFFQDQKDEAGKEHCILSRGSLQQSSPQMNQTFALLLP